MPWILWNFKLDDFHVCQSEDEKGKISLQSPARGIIWTINTAGRKVWTHILEFQKWKMQLFLILLVSMVCNWASLREHLPKKNVFFRALPEWGGGEALARIKKYIIYIYLWRAKKMYKLPERRGGGGGGGVIRAMPERKHSFFGRCSLTQDNTIT